MEKKTYHIWLNLVISIIVLVGVLLLLKATGIGLPSGTLAGILLALSDAAVRPLFGGLFEWKAAILLAIIVLCLMIWRPFCKYLCPLGAVYGLFNRFAFYRGELDTDKCIRCGACAAACRMGVDPAEDVNSSECVRCGDCVRTCPTGAIKMGFQTKK